jgi:diaminohydroxyphosphoribosylaminopyrimidine deaminase/5-amino-6-(5-phosphoribosylamino)uracil reductase
LRIEGREDLLNDVDFGWMERALDLAQGAVGLASPNPTVGCVLVRDGVVLGEGAHQYDALDHAEIVALKQAAAIGHEVRGATAYVTLEPCSHHGRTPPCADALVQAEIVRCVAAAPDPNPQVSNRGFEKLRAAGVEVELPGAGSAPSLRARALNDAFACSMRFARPMVTLKAALSVDGKLAPPPAQRSDIAPHWVTGEAARADAQRLRHEADAIVSGIGTVLADDPLLSDRSGLARRRPLLRVVLDTTLRTPPGGKLVASAASDLLLVCGHEADATSERELAERGVDVLRLGVKEGRVDLHALLEELHRRRLLSVLLEAGAAVNGSFLREGLVDKLLLYYAENELGPDGVEFAESVGSPYALQQRLARVERASFPHGDGEDVRVSGYVRDPWA